jgi:hypothetical protein
LARSQLAINCPAPLLERLRAEAQRQQVTATSLVLAWIQAGLDGRLGASRPAPSSDLDQRLAAVEQRLDALEQSPEQGRPSSPKRVSTPSPEQGRPPSPERAIPRVTQSGQAITSAELADRLRLKRHALNARLARAGGGAIGLELDGWRIVGKVKPARGGPAQWVWLPAAAAAAPTPPPAPLLAADPEA